MQNISEYNDISLCHEKSIISRYSWLRPVFASKTVFPDIIIINIIISNHPYHDSNIIIVIIIIITIIITIIRLTIVMTGTAGSFGGWRKWAPDSSTPLSPSTWAACAKKLTPLHHRHHQHHHNQYHQHCDPHQHHHHLEHHQHVYENLGAALYADAGWWSIAGVYHFTRGHNISSYWSYLASSSLSSLSL